MISRIYVNEALSFKEVDLDLKEGLIVFTGPSGAGKSVLMSSFLSLFGYMEAKAQLSEVALLNKQIEDEAFGIEKDDEIVIKEIKKEKIRYFINNQIISKKNLKDFSKPLVKFLHLKDNSDFESSSLVENLDTICFNKDKEFKEIYDEYINKYKEYQKIKAELDKILEDELRIEELKEFAKFEIEKIATINPKVEEYEELSSIKQKLSKKDKIEEVLQKAKPIFSYSDNVSTALDMLEVDSSFFDDAINELNNVFEKFNDSLYELEDINIEEVLDRIEQLSSLQKRFGSIQEAIDYKAKKEEELSRYENITFEKEKLVNLVKTSFLELEDLASIISNKRENAKELLVERINHYLKFLYLSNASLELEKKDMDISGFDKVVFKLDGVSLETISSGEFNRLRLALLTSISEFEISENGILFLDEIDANLSGKESNAIAKVLATLSKSYQIFAISHQPQLTATANQHFLVDKKDGVSIVKELDRESKIKEISRMISADVITKEALEFAKNLVKENENSKKEEVTSMK